MGRLHEEIDRLPRGAARIGAATLTATLAVTLAGGCSGGEKADPHDGAKPATLEQLAGKTGCKLLSPRNSADLRQGSCRTSDGRFTLVSFTNDKNQQVWLREAKNWGGSYLVGPRWIVVSTPETLQTLRKNVGGRIEEGDHHH